MLLFTSTTSSKPVGGLVCRVGVVEIPPLLMFKLNLLDNQAVIHFGCLFETKCLSLSIIKRDMEYEVNAIKNDLVMLSTLELEWYKKQIELEIKRRKKSNKKVV
jgi:hypothetical protein